MAPHTRKAKVGLLPSDTGRSRYGLALASMTKTSLTARQNAAVYGISTRPYVKLQGGTSEVLTSFQSRPSAGSTLKPSVSQGSQAIPIGGYVGWGILETSAGPSTLSAPAYAAGRGRGGGAPQYGFANMLQDALCVDNERAVTPHSTHATAHVEDSDPRQLSHLPQPMLSSYVPQTARTTRLQTSFRSY